MHGIKIEDEEKYNEVLKKYTVEKPIDSFNEDSNSVFDSIFGSENENWLLIMKMKKNQKE